MLLSFCATIALAHLVMADAGAVADGLLGGLGLGARGKCQQSFHLAGALAARGRGLGMGTHFGQRGELLVSGWRRQSCPCTRHCSRRFGYRPAWRRSPARWLPRAASAKARPKTSRSRSALTSSLSRIILQIPLAVGDIAIEHCAHQLSVAQYDLLVEAAGIVAQGDLVIGLRRPPSARRRKTRPRR